MPHFNQVIFMGHLTRDVEIKFTPSGMALASFGLAANHTWRDKTTNEKREEVTFVDCECWGKRAEVLQQYVSKGSALFVEGRLKLDQWDDKSTGQKRSKLKIVVEEFQFVGGKGEGAAKPTAKAATKKQPATVLADDDENNLDIQEETIPF